MKTAGRFTSVLVAALATAGSVSASRAGGRASAPSAGGGGGVGMMHSANNEVAMPRVDAALDEPLITPSGLDADTAKAAATVTGGQAVAEVGRAEIIA